MMKATIKILFFLLCIPIHNFGQSWISSNQLKSNDDLRIIDIKKGEEDNFYATGTFKGSFEGNVSEGNRDIFIVKLDEEFNIKWVKTIGSSLLDFDPRITIDMANNIFIVGAFQDSCIFDNNYLKSDGSYDIFLAKYNSNGDYIWSKKVGSYASRQNPTDIDVDNENNLIITGHYSDSIYMVNKALVNAGKNNFYAKFDTSGVNIWVKNISGTSTSSRIANVKIYQNEYYFNGYFRDDMNFDIGTISSDVSGQQDIFLFKTDINGNGIWLRRTYGDDIDVTGSITGDSYGNVYFTGYFQSSTFAADSTSSIISTQVLTHVNDFDIFILKYNKNGSLIWAKQFGGNGRDYGVDLNVNNNILYMSGYFSDNINFGITNLSSSGNSDRDMFLTALDLNANTYNSISLGGSDGNDIAAGAIVLSSGQAVISGFFQSTSLIVGDSLYNNTSLGLRDGIVAKYSAPLSVVFSEINNVKCNSETNGKLVVTPEFGKKDYTYFWSHDPSLKDSVATSLSSGIYTVTVTDALDSTTIVSQEITQPDPIIFNPVINNVVACSYSRDGSINLNVQGGNGGFDYTWNESNGGYGSILKSEDQALLLPGTYKVTVTDSKSCTADTTIEISGPDPITFAGSVVTDSSSLGAGAINLHFSGGTGMPASFSFDWENTYGDTYATEDISNLRPANYNVTVTDVNLCEYDTVFNVANLDTFYIYISDYKDACKGTVNGEATVGYLSPDGHTNITYLWDGNASGQTTAKAINLAPGRYYHVTVTDVENNPDIVMVDSVYISELAYTFSGEIFPLSTTTLNCYGDRDGYIDITITSDGQLPYTYNWSNSSTTQDITGLTTGTYNVTITDDNGCEFLLLNHSITQPSALAAVAEIVNEPNCTGSFNGKITVDRSGGTPPYSYQWDDPAFQKTRYADGLDAGYYKVTVTDIKNCNVTSGIELTDPDPLYLVMDVYDITCYNSDDGAVIITETGGALPLSFFWTTTDGSGLEPANRNQGGLTAGKYYVSAIDFLGCTTEDSVEITIPSEISIISENYANSTRSDEPDGSVTVEARGGTGTLVYVLRPDNVTNTTGIFNDLYAGEYTVEVSDDNLCGPVISNSFSIGTPDAIIGVNSLDKIKVYPNPTIGPLYIELDINHFNQYTIDILKISGELVLSKKYLRGEVKEKIDLSEFSKGVYFIRVYNKEVSYNGKIILQ